MNKAELASALSRDTGLPLRYSEITLDSFIKIVSETLSAGDSVKLVGFGTFETRIRKARMGRNVKKNIPVPIPERKIPYFEAGKSLKDLIEKSKRVNSKV